MRNENPNLGKLPPQAREMEQTVIGAVLIEKDAVHVAINIVHADCFYVDAHQRIWRAITALYHANEPIDTLTVTQKLRDTGELDKAGGPYVITALSNTIGSGANVETHAYVVKECYLKRRLISISSEAIKEMYDDTVDFFDGFDKLTTEIESIHSELNRIQQISFSDSVAERVTELKKAGETKTYKTGVTTDLEALDKQTMGFQPTDLIIVAARPSMGKTALIVQFMRKQAIAKIPVGCFSLEMSTAQLIDRMLSSDSGVDLKQIRKGGMNGQDWRKIDDTTATLMGLPMYVCDKAALSLAEISSIAKQWKIKYDIQILYVDYLQLCSGNAKKNTSREQEISEISRGLKKLAKELKIPVIALSQLSRAVEIRGDKRPILSDLRESGAIEQDADMVIFLYREIYYNENYDKPEECELIIAKYRNGSVGKALCNFSTNNQRFTDLYKTESSFQSSKDYSESYKQNNSEPEDDNPF